MMFLSEPFDSLEDIRERLLPFNCYSFPEIPDSDDLRSELNVLEPLCESILTRKRRLEQDFRARFNRFNSEITTGEDLMMTEFLNEAERDQLDKDWKHLQEQKRKKQNPQRQD